MILKIIYSFLLYDILEDKVNLICEEYMDTKWDHQEEYAIKAATFNHWYYFKTASVDIMDVSVISHTLLTPDLVISEGAPRSHPTGQGTLPFRFRSTWGVLTGARGGPWFSFDINHFKNPFKKFLLFSILLLFYWANKLRTNENLNRKEIGLDK